MSFSRATSTNDSNRRDYFVLVNESGVFQPLKGGRRFVAGDERGGDGEKKREDEIRLNPEAKPIEFFFFSPKMHFFLYPPSVGRDGWHSSLRPSGCLG